MSQPAVRKNAQEQTEIRDLGDFCLQWSDLRGVVSEQELTQMPLDPRQREIVNWLRLLADKVATRPKF